MSKGLIPVLISLVFMSLPATAVSEGEIYKIVNPDGSVTFTDQRPSPGAEPVELRPLSVVETDISVPEKPAESESGAESVQNEPTPRELKRMFSDFSITQPQNEETFWGAENQVVVSWGASRPIPEDMRVVLYVDGSGQSASTSGAVTLTLERGEHNVYAVLRDANNRRVAATDVVTFFVKQHSVNFNRPVPTPRNRP